MDYGKISKILTIIYQDGVDLAAVEYLPEEFWKELEDGLQLSTYITAGWAEPTEEGKSQLEYVWRVLCDMRELDPEVMYDTPMDFFEAQVVDAEVIPIDKNKS